MQNPDIADIFDEVADLLDIQGVEWKPKAYRRASINIRNYSEPLEKVYKDQGIKGLKEVPGVGENIAIKIEEIIKTGKLNYLANLKKQIPEAIEELMQIQSIGPKTAKKIYDKFKIKDLAQLKKIIEQGKLRKVKGFGEKKEKDILQGIEHEAVRGQRHLLGDVLPIAEDLKETLKKSRFVKRVFIAGSLARMKETIGDIDILAVSSSPKKVMDYFTRLKDVKEILAKGDTKSSVILQNGIQVDLRIVEERSFGSAVQYFVGSKEHNIRLRQIAIKKGLKLSEYGLFKGNKQIAGKDESEIYKKLGMKWIPYEIREDRGEIQASMKNKLPSLIGLKDIKGDFHCHTTYSDGSASVQEMAKAGIDTGYEYMAITDHSQNIKIAHGTTDKERLKQFKEIDKFNKSHPRFKILKGIEADILKDGSLDCSKALLKELDLVIASIHSGFKQDKNTTTKRILKAMDNPYMTILGHPTARLIFEREPLNLDIEKIIDKAKERGIVLEINAHPARLDLNDINARLAKEKGVMMAIDTDSHSTDSLNFMQFGIGVARRAWCEKKDILNTMPLKKLEKFLAR